VLALDYRDGELGELRAKPLAQCSPAPFRRAAPRDELFDFLLDPELP